MVERMTQRDFHIHCQSPVVWGYGLRECQQQPNNFQELVDFIGERLELDGPPFTVSTLSKWLMTQRRQAEEAQVDCATIDSNCVETTILIGELADRDSYVGSWPAGGVNLPSPNIIRSLLQSQ